MQPGAPAAKGYRFGLFEVDRRSGELRKNGTKVKLQEQPFQILLSLLDRPGEVVTRDELRRKLWSDSTFVDFDQSLATALRKIREALGDSASNPRFVETLPGRGYRFIGSVETSPAPSQATGERVEEADLRRNQRFLWALLAITAIALLAGSFLYFRKTPAVGPEPPLRKFTFTPPVDLVHYVVTGPALSPNGKYIAFVEMGWKLWIQDLESGQPRAITEMAGRPFWSPDSDFVGFGSQGELRKVSVHGGQAIRVCQIPGATNYFWGSWSPDGNSIVFVGGSPPALYEVPAVGGNPRPLSLPEQVGSPAEISTREARWPHFLPSEAGDRVLVFESVSAGDTTMVVQDLKSGRREVLVPGALPFYSPSGHLLYQPSFFVDQIWALPFSLDTLRATGEAFPIAQGSRFPTVSGDQTLVFMHKPPPHRQLVWLDQGGIKIAEISSVEEDIYDPTLSPDGQRIAFRINWDLWVSSLARGVKTRLTSGPEADLDPVWSPDGQQVAFSSHRAGSSDIFVKPAHGGGGAKALLATPRNDWVCDWSPNGKYLLYLREDPETAEDLWYLEHTEGDNWGSYPFIQEPRDQWSARFSPDGRYVAYTSDASGQHEIYVRPFPEGGQRETVSNNGGRHPRWRRDGKELFYLEGAWLVAVPVSTDPSFSAGRPRRLFENPSLKRRWDKQYDVSADGQRFVIAEEVGAAPEPSIRVVQNWFAEFRDRQGEAQ